MGLVDPDAIGLEEAELRKSKSFFIKGGLLVYERFCIAARCNQANAVIVQEIDAVAVIGGDAIMRTGLGIQIGPGRRLKPTFRQLCNMALHLKIEIAGRNFWPEQAIPAMPTSALVRTGCWA